MLPSISRQNPMPKNTPQNVKDLALDLKNFRTVPQADEEHATNALIGIEPEWFWALMESLLDDGYSPTENIIVLKNASSGLIVKEGNRRIAALKLILGIHKSVEVPDHIQKRIDGLSATWKKQNALVPCAIYEAKEAAHVDKLVSRTHAKGEKAGRADWTAVAKARYARDQNKGSEPGLDLLEKYLKNGKNLSPQQAERWAGDYNLTVLDEAIAKLAPPIGAKNAADVAALYPAKNKRVLDNVLHDIGVSHLGFREIRDTDRFWAEEYGVEQSASGGGAPGGAKSAAMGKKKRGQSAYASNDPKSVRKILRGFNVRGRGRDKIVTLVNEMKGLWHEDHPHAFCFLLRSTFELSAKAYCDDHKKAGGPKPQKNDGKEKSLASLLREITNQLIAKDPTRKKLLHGAMAELGKPNGFLSVTSLNQLVHNPSFSIAPPDISLLFCNVFPLLQEMNS
jgi:hypothetical protein